MKTGFIAAAVMAATAFAAPAFAWEGRVVACYDKQYVGAEYKITKKLIRAAEYKWEHAKSGQVVKVYYPAVYEQIKTQVSNGYYLEVPATCK